ncbi:MAG: M6 family metalloprotease domain-containing protein [Muribaculaceae bacterium]|nr:M6 family metalloprotease domain-containing protein [Muribaculaceae bacterium]
MINFKHMLAALALSLPGLLTAVNADPRPRTITNPDGSTVTIRVHGNEFFHFMTDEDCTRILQYDDRGFVTDAVRDGQTLAFSRDNVMMLADEAMKAFPAQAAATVPSMQRMAELTGSGRSTYPTIGKGNRSLVVLVEFQDVDFTVENPKDYYTRQLNEPGFSDYGAFGSAYDYYVAASNGLYQPQFDVLGPVKVSHNADYYKDMGSPNMAELIKEAITLLHDDAQLDLSNYDLDENGIVDTVFIYYAGYGSADSKTETIWPHQYDYRALVGFLTDSYIRFDGKTVGPYACANELSGTNPVTGKEPWKDGSEPWVGGIGTFVHEYGHVLGLPDLYDTAYSGEAVTPGKWDVMDQGSYNFDGCRPPLFSAYEQWVCNWLEYTDAVDGTHYDLKALGGPDAPGAVRIRIPMSADGKTFHPEYFVIEARDNSNWNSCFSEPGLMIWRINYNRTNWVNNTVNTKDGSNVEIVYSNGKRNPVFTEGAIYKGAQVELTPSKDYSLWKSPIITSIGYDKDSFTGSFDYNMATPTELFTVLHDSPVAASDGSRAFKLTWDPVEGVDSYLLTVQVKGSGRIIGDFDAKDLGQETSVWIDGISSILWRLEMEAFVTCAVNGLAGTNRSNVISFKPSELLLDDAAVDGVEVDSAFISGGVGCVYAPDGAQVYDMTGNLLQKDGLAAGVYIVIYGRRSEKVLVR